MIKIYHLTTKCMSAFTNMVTLWSYKQILFTPSSAIRPAQHAAPGKIFSVPGMIGSTTPSIMKNHLQKLVNMYNKTRCYF